MSERKEELPAQLLDDFADYCLYLSQNNRIEQRFSMEHFVARGFADRFFTLTHAQLTQLKKLIIQHKNSDEIHAKKIKHEIEHQFLSR